MGQERKPYLATDYNGDQWVVWCYDYPHAMNKAYSLNIDHRYLRELTHENDAAYLDALPYYLETIHDRHGLEGSPWAKVKPSMYIPAASDKDTKQEEDTVTLNIIHELPDFRVEIYPVDDKHTIWEAVMTVTLDDGDEAELTSHSEVPFYAYLKIAALLNKLGVAGFVLPDLRIGDQEGVGLYGLPSEQERMPLKANGGL